MVQQPAPLPSQGVIFQPSVSQEAIETQEMLVVPGYQRSIPKKEFYTKADFAELIGTDCRYASMIINNIKRANPTITGQPLPPEARKGKGTGKIILYTKEELLELAKAHINRPKPKIKAKAQIPREELGRQDGSELPGATMKPAPRKKPRSDPESRKIIPKSKIALQMGLESSLDILSDFAAGKPERINRNSRVILGRRLPAKATIPQIFGLDVTQEELNEILVSSFTQAIQKWWDKDPKGVEKVSEVELQIAEKCQQLRTQEGYKTEGLIRFLRKTLGMPPPIEPFRHSKE